jgi:DNA adenine methylase
MRQSFFSLGAQRQNKGWHMAKQHVNCQGGETVSRFNNGVNKLREVAAEIRKNFQITNRSYVDCIDSIDFNQAFFYADPPYPKQSRASFNDYKFEFADSDHEALAKRLHSIEGLAMVSGYYCDLMNDLYGDWHLTRFPTKKNNIRSGEVQECVWTNYNPQLNKKLTLF